MLDSAEHALVSAAEATSDTFVVALEGYEATPRGETVLFNILTGFAGGFVLMRVSTAGIRSGWWPTSDIKVGGRHIHHFVPGILIAFLAGGAGLITQNDKLEQALAFPFGAGIGLTFDEAAPAARPPRRLLDPRGDPERAALVRPRRDPGRHDHLPADAAPRRGACRGARRPAAARPRAWARSLGGLLRLDRGSGRTARPSLLEEPRDAHAGARARRARRPGPGPRRRRASGRG